MANYVTTNIRLLEEDYLRLKEEAAKKRKSLSAIIRGKIGTDKKKRSDEEVEKLLMELDEIAKENATQLKGVDGVSVIRKMRKQAKW